MERGRDLYSRMQSLGPMLTAGITDLVRDLFCIFKESSTDFYSGHTSLYSHQESIKVPLSPYLYQHILSFFDLFLSHSD